MMDPIVEAELESTASSCCKTTTGGSIDMRIYVEAYMRPQNKEHGSNYKVCGVRFHIQVRSLTDQCQDICLYH